MNKTLVLLMCGLLAACAGGKAVRVDCDGPLTLISPPVAPADGKAAPKSGHRTTKPEARRP